MLSSSSYWWKQWSTERATVANKDRMADKMKKLSWDSTTVLQFEALCYTVCEAQGPSWRGFWGDPRLYIELGPITPFPNSTQPPALYNLWRGDILFFRIGPDSLGSWLSSSNSWGCFKKKCLEICGVHEQMASWKCLLKFLLLDTEVDRVKPEGLPPPPQDSHVSFSFHSSPALENPYPCLNTSTKQTHAEAICIRLYDCLKYSLAFSMEDYSSLPH